MATFHPEYFANNLRCSEYRQQVSNLHDRIRESTTELAGLEKQWEKRKSIS